MKYPISLFFLFHVLVNDNLDQNIGIITGPGGGAGSSSKYRWDL